jgi:formate/nitrite transporter FocA (FNT family)
MNKGLMFLGALAILAGVYMSTEAVAYLRAGKTVIPATRHTKLSTPPENIAFGIFFVFAGGYTIRRGFQGKDLFR